MPFFVGGRLQGRRRLRHMVEQTYIPPVRVQDVESTFEKEYDADGWTIEAAHIWQTVPDALEHARQLFDDNVELTYDDVEGLFPAEEQFVVRYKYDFSPCSGRTEGILSVYTWAEYTWKHVASDKRTEMRWMPFLEDDNGEQREFFEVEDGVLSLYDPKYNSESGEVDEGWKSYPHVKGRAVTPAEFAHYHFFGGGEYPSEAEQIRQALHEEHPNAKPLADVLGQHDAYDSDMGVLAD